MDCVIQCLSMFPEIQIELFFLTVSDSPAVRGKAAGRQLGVDMLDVRQQIVTHILSACADSFITLTAVSQTSHLFCRSQGVAYNTQMSDCCSTVSSVCV